MPDPIIRAATEADADAITSIYNHYVRTSTATFDTDEKTVDDRIAWLAEHRGTHPVLVAKRSDGTIVGWGALSRWGTRGAYRHSVEISAYVAPEATREGIGPLICGGLIAQARRLGHHAIISQIVADNEPSLKMGARLGFETIGRFREVGRKFGRWLDVVLMELVLDSEPFEEPPS